MKIYLPHHPEHAGHWIYEGYKNAWEALGYDAEYLIDFGDFLKPTPAEYQVMLTEALFVNGNDAQIPWFYDFIKKAQKVYLFVQPNNFPDPWGSHPNFMCQLTDEKINSINELDNVYLWSFTNGKNSSYYDKWKEVHYIPLAFDDVAYQPIDDKEFEYDICYIGGLANNGFNEKMLIMQDYFHELSKMGIKLGIRVNQNISLEDEAKLLYNSKIAINLHDNYQHVLGLDSNERTFKSLGLNGFLISDNVKEVGNLFPTVPLADSSTKMCELVERYLDQDLTLEKERNKELILQKHTYKKRVEKFLTL
jgi:hypothetical protein